MEHQRDEYRKIAKGTAIFGGVQVFNILIGIIKSKVSAVFLGVEGVGVFGLFTVVIDLVRNITGLGLNTSSVREISYHSEDDIELTRIVSIVRRLCWLTGGLGMMAMLILAPWLSLWTFDTSDHTVSFMILSVIPLFQSVGFGQLSVLQGLRKFVYLAKANLYGGLCGLTFLIPLYWWLGVQGIVPFMVIAAAITLGWSYYFANQLKIKSIALTIKHTCTMGAGMVRLGILLTLTAFSSALINYAIRIFITTEGGLVEVGLYTAATSIFITYIGLVFSAMGTDFFPRLSAVRDDSVQMGKMTNRQAEIGVLILTPMVIALIILAPLILTILYTESFAPASQMLRWSMLGVLLQTATWPLAFVILAKANNKIFLFKELGSGFYLLLFSLLGYKCFGLAGVGMGYVLTQILGLIQNSLINKLMYDISLNNDYFKTLIPSLLMVVSMFVSVMFLENTVWLYLVGIMILGCSVWLSYRELNKKMGLTELIQNRFKK